ncbi:MAG: hypothetical protein Q8O82_19215 [Pseudorhodobacter sp.]|nr:hypothetical protein [Pseudorhodobacter sp.]
MLALAPVAQSAAIITLAARVRFTDIPEILHIVGYMLCRLVAADLPFDGTTPCAWQAV